MHSIDLEVIMSRVSSLVDAGGPVVIALAVMSIAGLTILLLKTWQFYKLQIERKAFINQAIDDWRVGNFDSMKQVLRSTKNPIARVMEAAAHASNKEGISDQIAREEVLRVATIELSSLRKHLRIIEVIAALSPLLGLFGTVLGMIEAFHRLEQAGSAVDPSVLSGGIWEALLTTAAGLAVAIPAIIALNWLEHRLENFKLAMEDAMTRIFTSNAMTNN